MADTLVSIVICCYNRVGYLSKAIESAMSQKYDPVEILVVDDGSTDGTSEFVKKYRKNLRYYRHDNMGIAKTRTIACQLAKGEMIAFLDDDDLMPKNRITTLYEALCQYPLAVLAVGDWAQIDKNGILTGNRLLPERDDKKPHLYEDGYTAVMWPYVPAVPHTTLFRKSDGEKIGWFNTKYRYASEDKDFFARLGKLGPLVYIPEIVSFYRYGHTSLTANAVRVAYHQILLFEEHLKMIPAKNEKLRKRLKERILNAFKMILLVKKEQRNLSETIPLDNINNVLKILEPRQKLNFWITKYLKLPLKQLLKTSRGHKFNDS